MKIKSIELSGFKSFAKKTTLTFDTPITAIVGPNGSGKSNVAEAFRWVLGEQSLKSLRGKRGEDLIFNGSGTTSRLHRALVTLTFDNGDHRLPLAFDEISITREVGSDGVNEYSINKSKVRLKDVVELLAGVGLGPTGHHIISQGEADRILRATPRERQAMIEDALSLKVYHLKIAESERKLEKTQENLKQVSALRKEIAPHLKFLSKQMEKLAQRDAVREELTNLYRTYLSTEEAYCTHEKERLGQSAQAPHARIVELTERITALSTLLSSNGGGGSKYEEVLANKLREIGALRSEKEDLTRRIGRLEGLIEAKEEVFSGGAASEAPVPRREVESFLRDVEATIVRAEHDESAHALKVSLLRVRELIRNFLRTVRGVAPDMSDALTHAREERQALEIRRGEVLEKEEVLASEIDILRREIDEEGKTLRDTEREIFTLRSEKSAIEQELELIRLHSEQIAFIEREFREEWQVARMLIGREAHEYSEPLADLNDRPAQEARKKQIERLKIKLEDLGAGGDEIAREYREANERDTFLAREVEDLTASMASLQRLLEELHQKLEEEFSLGIEKINTLFNDFFTLMFGGGSASIRVVKERKVRRGEEEGLGELDESVETGIEVEVSLPRKKIRGIHMLSGGERALTSIALLFAITQVNPPPFLILDETDAALDEANSRRYGDMVESLSRYSQLIVITHNRETMSRAGVLYGVTMGADSISKILSIRFDEAVAVAK